MRAPGWLPGGPFESGRQYVGACRAQLRIDRRTVHSGEAFTGALVLWGGSRGETVRRAEVALAQMSEVHSHPTVDRLARADDHVDLRVAAGEERILSFSIVTPRVATISRGTFLLARIEVRGEEPLALQETVRVLPSVSHMRLVRLLEELSGLRCRDLAPYAGGDGLAALLAPAPGEAAAMDGICLRWIGEHDPFRGEVVVNPRQRTIADYARNFFGADRQGFRIEFPLNDLSAAREQFAAILERFRPVPEAVRDLPIPAGPDGRGHKDLPLPSNEPRPGDRKP